MKIEEALNRICRNEGLEEVEMRSVMNSIMKGEVTSSQIGALLMGLRVKGETCNEILGAVKALRDNMTIVDIENKYLIDTCGTGGDGGKTFNISTIVAIVAASGGALVAKHGNRSVSSKSGSADVLKELGIRTDCNEKESKILIEDIGMGFLFAPNFHKAMKNVAKERQELGTRTIFNLIGPLVNPAPIKGQLLGIYDGNLVEIIGDVLLKLGLERALVVHGEDGLDEITIADKTKVCEIKNGVIKNYYIEPEDFGIEKSSIESVSGGSPKENAEIIVRILKGEKGPKRDIVILNSGAALYVAKKVESIKDGVEMAKNLIDSGKAYGKYQELRGQKNDFR
ncbi:MAG: anthranilate phosphoribosyltransferase [Clostridium sp.]